MEKIAGSALIAVTIAARMPSEASVTIAVNGVSQTVPTGVETLIREDMLEALTNSDRNYSIQTRPSSDGAAGSEGVSAGAGALAASDKPEGKRDGPDDTHGLAYVEKEHAPGGYAPAAGVAGAEDPAKDTSAIPGDTLVAPTDAEAFDADAAIEGNVDVVKARLASLTPEQLEKVKLAEADREQPRAGVLAAIDKAITTKAAPAA